MKQISVRHIQNLAESGDEKAFMSILPIITAEAINIDTSIKTGEIIDTAVQNLTLRGLLDTYLGSNQSKSTAKLYFSEEAQQPGLEALANDLVTPEVTSELKTSDDPTAKWMIVIQIVLEMEDEEVNLEGDINIAVPLSGEVPVEVEENQEVNQFKCPKCKIKLGTKDSLTEDAILTCPECGTKIKLKAELVAAPPEGVGEIDIAPTEEEPSAPPEPPTEEEPTEEEPTEEESAESVVVWHCKSCLLEWISSVSDGCVRCNSKDIISRGEGRIRHKVEEVLLSEETVDSAVNKLFGEGIKRDLHVRRTLPK